MENVLYACEQIQKYVGTLDVTDHTRALAVYGAVRWFNHDLQKHFEDHKVECFVDVTEKCEDLEQYLKKVCGLESCALELNQAKLFALQAAGAICLMVRQYQEEGILRD